MPRTWSNVRYVNDTSAAQRARQKRSSATPFSILLFLTALLFLGITAFSVVTVFHHPQTEAAQPAAPPQDK